MIEIAIPEQGVSPVSGADQIVSFFDSELNFYEKHASLFSENLRFGPNGLNSSAGAQRRATEHLSELKRSAEKGDYTHVEEYVNACRHLSFVVGAGVIGRRIDMLVENNEKDAAHWLFRIYSSFRSKGDPWIDPFRAIAVGHPAAFADLNRAENTQRKSANALKRSEQAEKRVTKFIDEKAELITSLEELYRKKLPVEAPAINWENIANEKKNIWRLWLAIFGILILGPILLIASDLSEFSSAIGRISSGPNGSISFGGLAAVSIPALFYAWLLKNVSRIFIQNLTLSDDAAHRKALAVTYLGLAENEKVQILDAERALILNALFRPLPPNSNDEGPPIGLLELLKK